MVTQTACAGIRQCWLRAWLRAQDEQLIPFPNLDGSWNVNSYTVTMTGAGWSDLSCPCPAGQHHRTCKHMAVVAKAIVIGVRPMRGTEKA